MDSSPVLRQQNQSKISNFLRMKNEQAKMNHPKSPKSAAHHSNQDENKDPQKPAAGEKAPVRPGVSRLPVLAKSLHLPTPSSFGLSNCQWEEKPLAGKTKKEKQRTRPLPFSRTYSKTSRKAAENEQHISVLQSKAGIHGVHQNKAARSITQEQSNGRANPSRNLQVLRSNVDLTKSAGRAEEHITENTSQLRGQHGTVSTVKPPAHLSHHLSTVQRNTLHPNSPASSAEACIHNMTQLSIKDLSMTPRAQRGVQLTEQAKSSAGENFQADHTALLSILRNEGVSAAGLGSKPYNNLPQRVSVCKNKPKPGPTAGFTKSEPFSPDPAALQSILQNEGVKAGGFLGATPINSIRPSGRGTSVYTAQRVHARKQQVKAAKGPAAEVKEPVGMKWTPQRVPNTRNQPMSAMKWHLSKQPSPFCITPGLRSCKTTLKPHQEQEIVQRLFDDPEEESSPNGMEKDPEKPVQDTATKYPEGKEETCSANESEQQRTAGAQPLIQTPQRDSVIFFSTGKKLLRVPRFEQQDISTVHEQDRAGPSEPRQVLLAQEETREESQPTCPPAAVQSVHNGNNFIVQKSCGVSSAVAMLRKRLPPFEELRLDEEVATYTVSTRFLPPRPRCGNPLAAMLHFEESSMFIPIGLDPSPDPMWPCSLMEGR